MASKEIVGKYTYTKADGTKTTGSKTFTGCEADIDKATAKDGIVKYSKIVDGELTAAQFKTVEDLDID